MPARTGRVSKTLSEARACVSARAETGKGEHGVRDPVFAFRPVRAGNSRQMNGPAIRIGPYHCSLRSQMNGPIIRTGPYHCSLRSQMNGPAIRRRRAVISLSLPLFLPRRAKAILDRRLLCPPVSRKASGFFRRASIWPGRPRRGSYRCAQKPSACAAARPCRGPRCSG